MQVLPHVPSFLAALLAPHAGHGRPGSGGTLLHWLLEPVHLPVLLLALAVLAVLARAWTRARSDAAGRG